MRPTTSLAQIVVTITERVLNEDGSLHANASSPTGIYNDELGPRLGDNSSHTYYQYFVTSVDGTFWQNVPTPVFASGVVNPVLSLTISTKYFNGVPRADVSINGDAGMWNPDGTPRLPICTQLPK